THQRAAHRDEGRLQDVDALDLAHARRADADFNRALPDHQREFIALLEAELFRIVELVAQPARDPPAVEDHGGRNHRPGERAAPRFVDAADDAVAAALQYEIGHSPRIPSLGGPFLTFR